MHRQFFWSACQSIEKYIKAILVINDKSALPFRHDIQKSFDELVKIKPLEILFTIPKQIEVFQNYPELWGSSNIEDFIIHINQNGHPDSRYDTFSTTSNFTDLYKLDQLIFKLRSLCSDEGWSKEFVKLISNSEYMLNALCDNNFKFFPEFKHTKIPCNSKSHVTELQILFNNEVSEYSKLRHWVKLNIYKNVDKLKFEK